MKLLSNKEAVYLSIFSIWPGCVNHKKTPVVEEFVKKGFLIQGNELQPPGRDSKGYYNFNITKKGIEVLKLYQSFREL